MAKSRNPQLAGACYFERIDLSAHGFYRTPDLHFDFATGKGRPFNYFTYGAAASEVEIDTLTGDMTVRKTDIVMDLGRSLNPAIDIGQVRGWWWLEELWVWDRVCDSGRLVLKYSRSGFRIVRCSVGDFLSAAFGKVRTPICSELGVGLESILSHKTGRLRLIAIQGVCPSCLVHSSNQKPNCLPFTGPRFDFDGESHESLGSMLTSVVSVPADRGRVRPGAGMVRDRGAEVGRRCAPLGAPGAPIHTGARHLQAANCE